MIGKFDIDFITKTFTKGLKFKKFICGEFACKFNEIIDAVNELTNCVGQLGVEFTDPTPAKNMQDKFIEQRKWIGKLCYFWDNKREDGFYDVLGHIDENDEYTYVRQGYCDVGYLHCEPVKPDDDVIYNGE